MSRVDLLTGLGAICWLNSFYLFLGGGFDNYLKTMQGQRALDFVLRNQGLIDKTLLFDIELIKVTEN
jgi:hypothetical protein